MFSTLHRRSVAIRSRAGTAVGPHGAHGEEEDAAIGDRGFPGQRSASNNNASYPGGRTSR